MGEGWGGGAIYVLVALSLKLTNIRYLLTVGSFYTFCAFSCNYIPPSGCSALHEVNPN